MECTLCKKNLCSHDLTCHMAEYHLGEEYSFWYCNRCGDGGSGSDSYVYILPILEGEVDFGSKVCQVVCKQCHDKFSPEGIKYFQIDGAHINGRLRNIDFCIADLNAANITIVAHNHMDAAIHLEDGRVLKILNVKQSKKS